MQKLNNNYFTTNLRTDILLNTQESKADILARIEDNIIREIKTQLASGKSKQEVKKELEQLSFMLDLVQDTINNRGFNYFTKSIFNKYNEIQQNPQLKAFIISITSDIEKLAAHRNNYFGDPNTKHRLITGEINRTKSIAQLKKYISNIDLDNIEIKYPSSKLVSILSGTKDLSSFMDIDTIKNLSQVNKQWYDGIKKSRPTNINLAIFNLDKVTKNSFNKDWLSYLKYITNSNITAVKLDCSNKLNQEVSLNKKHFLQLAQAIDKNINILSFDIIKPNIVNKKLNKRETTIKKAIIKKIIHNLCKLDNIKLDIIRLKHIKLDMYVSPPKAFINEIETSFYDRQNLTRLDLSHCDLEFVPINTIKLFPNIKTINLSNNKIKTINFADIANMRVEDIDLSYNSIVSIEDGSFPDSLQVLELDNNRIEIIKNTTFTNLINLARLTISDNQITEIEPESFNKLHNLLFLELSNNKLKTIDNIIFTNCSKLQYINIADNPVEYIQASAYAYLSKISFSFNKVKVIRALDIYNFNLYKDGRKNMYFYKEFNLIEQKNLDLNYSYVIREEAYTKRHIQLFVTELLRRKLISNEINSGAYKAQSINIVFSSDTYEKEAVRESVTENLKKNKIKFKFVNYNPIDNQDPPESNQGNIETALIIYNYPIDSNGIHFKSFKQIESNFSDITIVSN